MSRGFFKMAYKWCVVPKCKSTSTKNPEKLFLSVPTDRTKRRKWLKLAQRDPKTISSTSNVFMCEDHFDIEKDTKNYMKYKMGFSQKLLVADDALPSKFDCHPDRKRRLGDSGTPRALIIKRERQELLQRCLEETYVCDTVVIDESVIEMEPRLMLELQWQ